MIDYKAEARKLLNESVCTHGNDNSPEHSEHHYDDLANRIITLCCRVVAETLEDVAKIVESLEIGCDTEKWFRITCAAAIRSAKEEEELNG